MSEAKAIEPQKFVVDDDQKAEWCLSKIKEARADKEFWKRFYDDQYRAVEETADETISQMELMLRDYFQTVPHRKTDRQESYKLPSGKLVMKKRDPEYIRKEDEVIKWLKENGMGQYVKVTEKLDWDGLKKTVAVIGDQIATADGEIVPGVNVVARDDVFSVEGVK